MTPEGTLESIADLLIALRAVPYRPSAGKGYDSVGDLVHNIETWWDQFGELVPDSPEYNAKYPPKEREGSRERRRMTRRKAEQIRLWREHGMSVSTLARRHGVTERTVRMVLDGEVWRKS